MLDLRGNVLTDGKGYRGAVLRRLGALTVLDGRPIADTERVGAARRGGGGGHLSRHAFYFEVQGQNAAWHYPIHFLFSSALRASPTPPGFSHLYDPGELPAQRLRHEQRSHPYSRPAHRFCARCGTGWLLPAAARRTATTGSRSIASGGRPLPGAVWMLRALLLRFLWTPFLAHGTFRPCSGGVFTEGVVGGETRRMTWVRGGNSKSVIMLGVPLIWNKL